jgi:hypothetical protein
MKNEHRVIELALQLVAWDKERGQEPRSATHYYWLAEMLVAREGRACSYAVNSVIGEALNSGDGTYRP